MIWKTVVLLNVALCVLSEEDAISEQRFVMHHLKPTRKESHIPNKSGDKEENAQGYLSYEFSYKVNDPKTHDIKGQHEKYEGDEVTGNYWLVEPSGRKRTVNYQANDDYGFNAQIHYTATPTEKTKADDINSDLEKDDKQENIETNNDKSIESEIGEVVQNDQERKVENENNDDENKGNHYSVEENVDEQNNADNQEDEANNISNVEPNNVDRTDYRNHHQANLRKVENKVWDYNNQENNGQENKKHQRENRIHKNVEKEKREKERRTRIGEQDSSQYVHENHRNRHNGHRYSKKIKQDNAQQYENNRMVNMKQKSNRNENLRSVENSSTENFNNDNKNTDQINSSREQNGRMKNKIRKGKNNNSSKHDVRNDKNYAYTDFASSDAKIVQNPDHGHNTDNKEIYEHIVRIYHPKIISSTPKGEYRKH